MSQRKEYKREREREREREKEIERERKRERKRGRERALPNQTLLIPPLHLSFLSFFLYRIRAWLKRLKFPITI
jgi:hypothetical protein